MSKADFGRIVHTLRRESHNEFDETMTQNDLADLAMIPLITLQKIEQGRQINLKPEIILNLANALNLCSFSRQAFFLASLGFEEKDLISGKIAQPVILEEIKNLLGHLQTPAFIANSFGDLILANPSFLFLLNIQKEKLLHSYLLCKNNIYRIFYSPEFEDLHKMMGDSYAAFARRCVLLFKAMTLKYRNHWYFQKILPELNHFPKFREQWQSSSFHNEDIFILSNLISITHPQLGPLKFISFPIQTITEDTDLFLTSYQPLDNRTIRVCAQITKEQGSQPIQLAPWLTPPLPDFLE